MSEKVFDKTNFQRYIDEFFEELELYDDYKGKHHYKILLKSSIDVFLRYESKYTAKEVYRMFFMIYQITDDDKSQRQEKDDLVGEDNTLLNLIDVMENYEEHTGALIDHQRDHFIHSVNVFLLGLAVYSQNKNYRDVFKRYIRNSGYKKYYGHDFEQQTEDYEKYISPEEFLYRWGIASLLHDIGYPFEIVGKQLKKIINDGVRSISNSYNVKLGIDFDDFDQFNSIVKIPPYNFAEKFRRDYNETRILNLFKPTEILAHKIARDFDFDENKTKLLRDDLNSFVEYMKVNDFIDHGFYSSILVLNSYGKVFQKYDKDYDFFFYPIVDSASAILLHNYYNKTLQEDEKPFNLKEMDPNKCPIAYLLILCDELQEWNRQPFGLVDLKKLHVNELEIEINDDLMDLKYILKDGFIGLGFSKDKEKFINEVLDLDLIFRSGVHVDNDVSQDVQNEIMRNIDIEDINAPDIFIRNIENIAIEINLKYNESIRKEYDERKSNGEEISEDLETAHSYLKDNLFDLEPEFQLSNIRQALSIPKKLNLIGCEIAPKNDPRPGINSDKFDPNEVLNLAKFEHQEWCKEKRGNGWVYGDKKDNKKRETPFLVKWDKLTEKIQKLDKDTVYNIPFLLDQVGLKVVRSKIRLLTYKMQDYYEKDNPNKNKSVSADATSEEKFNLLENHVKYANYKQANFLVQILNEKGYDIVDINDKGNPVTTFDSKDIEHFAEREHYGWCKLKYDLGWEYGKNLNVDARKSPNLVKWKDLSEVVKENNRNTFKNLPDMCAEKDVGLKIVKSE